MTQNQYYVNGIHTYGNDNLVVNVAKEGLSITTTVDSITTNFSLNGYGFLYDGQGATWADVQSKVQALKAVETPPAETILQVNNQINITNGMDLVEMTPTQVTAGGLTASWATIIAGGGGSNPYLSAIADNADYGANSLVINDNLVITDGINTIQINPVISEVPDGGFVGKYLVVKVGEINYKLALLE
jgi:hypothetical protein